ncbi:MAG TPA: biotin carboxylase N-terminal domain-containing protein [Acidimicrobiales bacterium]|nr:biotin carboxylase N-terminal domain-containing protein [Acidimicrobiales bacterium]
MRILVANRGEIARRIIRTASRLGHETVAVFADPDRDAPFTREATTALRLGPADLAESYLSIDRLLTAVDATGADAVHPGYGFLAENAAFARAVIAAGATWIGPHPDAIEAMGSKITARQLAVRHDVPVIPGFDASQDPADLAAAAEQIGYPVLVKAAAGGGGKGIRVVHRPADIAAALAEAAAEAQRSFGDGAMIVERYVQRPRHVEVQVVGDRHGNLVHLGTRECSVQRRYQKLLEEAPAPNLPDATRAALHESALRLARAIGYDSAGTVELIVDDDTGEVFFLEMNTRLQVEHPVTEAVTGLDLVELMIRSAAGEPLPITQDDVVITGHAVEARINAEDPAHGFAPRTGTITHLVVPDGVRWDSAVVAGDEITPFYDPMIAKLVVDGPDRPTALRRLARALDQLVVGGVVTTAGFHRWLVDQPPVVEGRVTTRFVDETDLPGEPPPATVAAARAWRHARTAARGTGPGAALGARRLTPHHPGQPVVLRALDGELHEVDLAALDADEPMAPASVSLADRSVAVNVAGHTHTFTVPTRSERWAPSASAGHGHASATVAPFPAAVTSVAVAPGDHVAGGDPVVVIEAMKMLHTLTATGPGVVAEVRVAPGDQVATHHVLVTFAPIEATP